MEDSDGWIVMLALRGIYVLAAVVGLACNSRVRRLPRQAFAAIRSAMMKASDGDEADLLVLKRLRELRLDHFRLGCCAMSLGSVPVNIFMLYSSFGRVPVYDDLSDVLALAVHSALTLVAICPCCVNLRTVDAIYGVISVLIAAFISPLAQGPEGFTYALLSCSMCMMFLNIMRRAMLASLAYNLIFVAGVGSSLLVHGDSITPFPLRLTLFALLVALALPGCAQVLDDGVKESIRKGLEVQAVRELHEAASALLRSCCEVVVELDAVGAILNEASELGGFLLQGPGRCFRGRLLVDLFAEAGERDSFLGRLSSPAPSEGIAQTMLVRMRDANRELVKVELLWFGFRHVDGQQRYMVGLREWNEQVADGAPLPTRKDSGSNAQAVIDDSASVSSAMEQLHAIVAVDATIDGLPIQICSEGFRSRIGRMAQGFHLADLADGPDGRHSFVNWVQHTVNEAIVLAESQESLVSGFGEGGGDMGHRRDRWGMRAANAPKCRATFVMRSGKLDATCRLLLKVGEPADLTNVQVHFTKIKWEHDRRRTPCERRAAPTTDLLRGTPTALASL